MLDEGFDISELAKWGKDSGISIAEVYNGNFQDLVQKQLDAGYDIRDLLVWGESSGITVGSGYSKEFETVIQNAISAMYPDTSGLVQWAIENGIALGQLFGENFSYYAEHAFWADWNTNGVQSIQSASDEALYYCRQIWNR